MSEQTWTSEEIRELIEFAQALRQENADLRAMVIASDSMIKNKEAEIKRLRNELWKL